MREAGLLFVHRLGDDDAGIVLVQLQQQRRAVFHHRNELLIAHPSGVEQDVIAQVANLVDHLAGVVDGAVVGAELDDRQAERAGFVGAFRRHFADLLAQVAFVEAVRVDAADKAEWIAGGFKYTGVAPAWINAPWWLDLWLLRSNSTRSPRVSRALVATLFEAEVPLSTK